MKIVLLQDVKNIGRKGDIKEVSEGHARNFLLPKKLAEIATEAAVKNAEESKRKQEQEKAAGLKSLRESAEKIRGREIIIKSKEKGGKLFGSINRKMIAEELARNNFTAAESSIFLKNPIKAVGEYKTEIDFGQGIKSNFILKVVPE